MSYSFDSEETHDVKIGDVKPLEKRLNVVFQVTDVGEEREINKRSGETHRVCDFTVADDTAAITLTLWNEDIDKVKVGDKIHIKNGWVGEWQGEPQLSTGRFGELDVVGSSDGAAEASKEEAPAAEAPAEDKPSEPKVEEEVLDNVEEEKVE